MKKAIIFLTIFLILIIGSLAVYLSVNLKMAPRKGGLNQESNTSGHLAATEDPAIAGEPLPLAEDAFQKSNAASTVKFPIFNYHHIRPMPATSTPINERSFTVTPESFEKHLRYFKDNGYQTVSLDRLLVFFDSGQSLW